MFMLDIKKIHVSRKPFFFTYQVDQSFLYIHEAKTIFSNIYFTKDLLVNSSRYLSKDAL